MENIFSSEKIITIYTDGSCLKPNGPGGWCCYIMENNITVPHVIISGNETNTTNNRMEMQAVIESLMFLSYEVDKKVVYKIYTDSKLVLNCASGLWNRNKNLDLWMEYDKVSMGKKIKWFWVKGHNGDKYNEIVDKIARKEANNVK